MTDREKKVNKAHGIKVPRWYTKQQCGIDLTPEEEKEREEYQKLERENKNEEI